MWASKTGRERVVNLLGPLAQDLREWRLLSGRPDPAAPVFPRPDGGAWTESDFRNWRSRVFAPAAPGIRPYDLRHSFVSLLLGEGKTVVYVAEQAGHSVEVCSRTYAHVMRELDPDRRVSAEQVIREARQLMPARQREGK